MVGRSGLGREAQPAGRLQCARVERMRLERARHLDRDHDAVAGRRDRHHARALRQQRGGIRDAARFPPT